MRPHLTGSDRRQIEDGPLLHVGEHAPGPTAEMDLVDAEPVRRDEWSRRIQGLSVLGEDATDRALGQPDLVGDAHERAPQGLALHIGHQALGGGMALVHVGQGLEERAAPGGTAVALPQHAERDLLAVDRQVQEQRLLGAEPLKLAYDATALAGGGCAPEGDRQLIGVLAFLEAPHFPVRPVQQVRAGRAAADRPCIARLRGGPATLAWSGP
jgi:hypothetical protein